MTTSGDVELTVLDGGGAVVVPGQSVQVVFGTAAAGDINKVVASRNPNSLATMFQGGPLLEYAAMCIAEGGTALCVRLATNTAGKVFGSDSVAINIVSSTNATPIVVTTAAHGRKTGDVVTIAGHLINTAAVGTWIIEVLSATTFRLLGSIGTGVGAATGTVQYTGVNVLDAAGTITAVGTSKPTITGTPLDSTNVAVVFTTGGTIASSGIKFKISLDAGRTYGPTISLGTALTYPIPDTGLTLNFSAGTIITNQVVRFSTVEPLWSTAGVLAAMNALQSSAYALSGWGSMMLTGFLTGADATTIQGYLNTFQTGKIYTRLLGAARDALLPTAWGGAGETEATWMDSVMTDFGSTVAKRICVSAGHYNMPSQIPKSVAGLPRFRRSLAWALGARQVTLQPQRHAGRVKDGPLGSIVVDAANDANDGFIYHDERLNPGFNGAKFASAKTRIKKKGRFIDNPNLMSDTGSVFTLLPLGTVMDIACGIVNEVGTEDINEDIRLNDNGTIFDNEAIAIEKRMRQALKDNMFAKNMISNYSVAVDRTNNVQTTSEVNVAVTIFARGYILQENITIGFGTAAAAA